MTWIDLALVLVVASVAALASERRLSGFFVGIGGVLLLRPLLVLADINPFVGLVAALVVGLGLSFLGRVLLPPSRGGMWFQRLLGAFGGLALGLVLVLALVTSLPIQRNPLDQIVYPPRDLPEPFNQAVVSSRMVLLGRDILLYPLLDAQGDLAASEEILRGLHSYLVVGEPWKER